MNYIREVSTKFKSGGISVSGYQVGTMSAIPAYKTVMSGLSSDPAGTSTVGKAVQAKKSTNNKMDFEFDVWAPVRGPGPIAARVGDGYGAFIAGRDVKQGFKIVRIKEKGSEVRYKVFESKHTKFKTSPKNGRNYKIYSKNYITSQVKIGNGQKLGISKFLNSKAGAVSALKSKLGIAGVGIAAIDNVRKNINNNENTGKIIGDAAVDVAIGAATLALGGAVSAAAVSIGAPVLLGAGIALGVSMGAAYLLDGFKINNKTIGTHIKNGVQSGVKSVAGWFKDTTDSIFDF